MSTDQERVAVQTYVPIEQRDKWRKEADDLDMSQAEFVRSMVQAGRRGFDLGSSKTNKSATPDGSVDPGTSAATPGVQDLEMRLLDVLQRSEFADWDRLLEGVTDDIEARLEDSLDELQAKDRIRYSGRHGGYTVIDDDH